MVGEPIKRESMETKLSGLSAIVSNTALAIGTANTKIYSRGPNRALVSGVIYNNSLVDMTLTLLPIRGTERRLTLPAGKKLKLKNLPLDEVFGYAASAITVVVLLIAWEPLDPEAAMRTAELDFLAVEGVINRVAGITPTASTFDTNPSNLGNLTDGNWTTETGEGVKSLAAAGVVGHITFDMGAAFPVTIIACYNMHRATGDGTIALSFDISQNGSTWVYSGTGPSGVGASDVIRGTETIFGYCRYFRLTFYASGMSGASSYHVKGVEVMALQLL